jgi:hypothetical protein
MELAPSDDQLRYRVAWDFEQRGMIPGGDRHDPPRRLPGAGPPGRIGSRAGPGGNGSKTAYRRAGTTRTETARRCWSGC